MVVQDHENLVVLIEVAKDQEAEARDRLVEDKLVCIP